jgi:hypothetical protein
MSSHGLVEVVKRDESIGIYLVLYRSGFRKRRVQWNTMARGTVTLRLKHDRRIDAGHLLNREKCRPDAHG